MKPRSLGRRMAAQFLFAAEVRGFDDAGSFDGFLAAQREAEEDAGASFDAREHAKWTEAADFARGLVDATLRDREAVDAAIAAAASNWDFGRIAATDKSVLRLAAAEWRRGGVDLAVVADEAVKLAKSLGGADSGAFVNGVLTGLLRREADPPADPPAASS